MINIYAETFRTATRTGTICVRDAAPGTQSTRKRWLPKGHWFTKPARALDPNRI